MLCSKIAGYILGSFSYSKEFEMSDYDGLRICESCRDAYTLGRLCASCSAQEQIDNDMSKLPSQEKVFNFDPPVRTGGTQTNEPRPDIDHFEQGHAYRPAAWSKKHDELRFSGWKLQEIGGVCGKCDICRAEHMAIDLVYCDAPVTEPGHNEQMFTHCFSCNWTVEQIAIYGSVENV
jgi:hypothetical protein